MAIADHSGEIIAVYEPENPDIFIGYRLHGVLVSTDSGYKIDSFETLPREGTSENPHQVIIHYSIDEKLNIRELQSYVAEVIDISNFEIPHPDLESRSVDPEQFVETVFRGVNSDNVERYRTSTARMSKRPK